MSSDSRNGKISIDDIDGLVFDLDGVLIDTFQLYLGVYAGVFEELVGRRFSQEELVGLATPTERGTLHAALPADLYPAGYELFQKGYVDLFDRLAVPFYKAMDALIAVRERGKRTGIFTGKTRFTAHFSLDRLGISDAVELLSSEDDYARAKPHAEGLERIMNEFALDPARTLFIGDQQNDIRAGESAGVITAAALWCDTASIARKNSSPSMIFHTEQAFLDFVCS